MTNTTPPSAKCGCSEELRITCKKHMEEMYDLPAIGHKNEFPTPSASDALQHSDTAEAGKQCCFHCKQPLPKIPEDNGDWVCENHPDQPAHECTIDGCNGAGMPPIMATSQPSASDALQKAREHMKKECNCQGINDPACHTCLKILEDFPSIYAELERVTAERDAALKGYRGMREGIQDKRKELWSFYHECQDWTMQKVAVKPFDDLLTSFPEIK